MTFDISEQLTIESIYDMCAEEYSKKRLEQGGLLFNEHIEMPVIKKLTHHVRRGRSVLDIGCGIGVYSKAFSQKGCNVTGIDISAGMLNKAKENCAGLPVDFIHSNFIDYEFEEQFNLILGSFMLGYFHDLDDLFGKVKSLLTKRGSAIFSMIHPVRLHSSKDKKGYLVNKYFDRGIYESDFLGEDYKIPLKKWTVSDICEAAYRSGLKVERLIEPVPSSIPLSADKKDVEFFLSNPSVVVFKFK